MVEPYPPVNAETKVPVAIQLMGAFYIVLVIFLCIREDMRGGMKRNQKHVSSGSVVMPK
jgi:hypothetical protein